MSSLNADFRIPRHRDTCSELPPSPVTTTQTKVSEVSTQKFQQKQDALNHIRNAARQVPTVALSENQLSDVWNGTAQVPGVFQLFTTPYRIGKYVYQKIKNTQAPALETTTPKVLKDIVQMLHLIVKGLLYLSFAGVAVGAITFASPLILATGFFISLLELGIESYKLHDLKKFAEEFNANSFKHIDFIKERCKELSTREEPPTAKEMDRILTTLYKVIEKDPAASSEMKLELKEILNKAQYSYDLLEQVTTDITIIERKLMKAHLEQLENRFFKLSEKEIDSIVNKTNDQFLSQDKEHDLAGGRLSGMQERIASSPTSQLEFFQAGVDLEHVSAASQYDVTEGLKLIQQEFEKKQMMLSRYLQPWLAEKIIASYQTLLSQVKELEALESSEEVIYKDTEIGSVENPTSAVDQAKAFLYAMDDATESRKTIYKTNIGLWILNLASLVAAAVAPHFLLLPVGLFIASLGIGINNEVESRYGLNKKDPIVAKVAKEIFEKIHGVPPQKEEVVSSEPLVTPSRIRNFGLIS